MEKIFQNLKKILTSNKLPYLIDFSNFDINFARNKIRLILIPMLKYYFNNNLETQIERLSMQFDIDNQFFESEISQLIKTSTTINKSEFKKLPRAIQYRFLKKVLKSYSGKDVNFNLIRKLQTKI